VRHGRSLAAILAAALVLGAAGLLPARVDEAAKLVEEVRGRKFERAIPASEMGPEELRRVLRSKLAEGFPASPEDTLRSLAALGLVEAAPNLLERLLDFYASQVVAFYDPEPRRFYLVRGAETPFGGTAMEDLAERLILAHELTHALQDEALRLDRRFEELRDNTDRTLALQSLLEGEATLVMVRAALLNLPGADEETEEMIGPLLSAGALERANVPKDIPEYFVDQLFFPYVEGTAFVRRAVKRGGWPEVDRLWRSPPLSTSEILHEGPAPPPAEDLLPGPHAALAPSGARFLYADTLGEWTIRFLLRRTLEPEEADAASAGWRGDRLAFFSSGAKIAFLWRLRFESPGAAARFEGAWTKSRQPGGPGDREVSRSDWPGRREIVSRRGCELAVASGFARLPKLPGFPAGR